MRIAHCWDFISPLPPPAPIARGEVIILKVLDRLRRDVWEVWDVWDVWEVRHPFSRPRPLLLRLSIRFTYLKAVEMRPTENGPGGEETPRITAKALI